MGGIMVKLTNEQKLYKRKIKKPGFIYTILGGIWKLFMFKQYGVEVDDKVNTEIRSDKSCS